MGGDQAFFVLARKLRNELPLHIRQAPSVDVFKSRLWPCETDNDFTVYSVLIALCSVCF